MKHLNIVIILQKKIKNSVKLLTAVAFTLFVSSAFAQSPSLGTTGFNDPANDQIPFASGQAAPNVMTATNVTNTGWSFHIGAIGIYTITQIDNGTGAYDGAITATNVTPIGFPKLYQTFAFTSTNNSRFKLNSVKVKIANASATPVAMILAGVVNGSNTGSTKNFVAMPGTNWTTVTTSSDPNYSNINGVIVINVTGSTSVAEMAIDDINISAAVAGAVPPVITSQPTNKTVCSNASTTFSGTATGAVSYFWLMSNDGLIWNPISASNAGSTFSGYNSNTLIVTNPSIALNGLYLGLTAVSSLGVNQGSNAARLFVAQAPVVPAFGGPSAVCVGSSITLTNSLVGGVWTSTAGRATVDASGSVTGTSGGNAVIRYTVGSSGCSSFRTANITVNSLPAVPSIGYAPGNAVNPQTAGGFCTNRTFSVIGSPSGGVWSTTGVIGVTNLGVVTTGNTPGAGTLTYTFTNSNGCVNRRIMVTNVIGCAARGLNATAPSNQIPQIEFEMYPNPVKNNLNLKLNFVTSKYQVNIFDMFGKIVKNQQLSIGNNSIDVSNLTKGIYLVEVKSNNQISTKKIVIE